MKRILIGQALLGALMVAASLVDASGWFGDMFIGALLAQMTIIAAGLMAEAICAGSGILVIKALEAWLNAS